MSREFALFMTLALAIFTYCIHLYSIVYYIRTVQNNGTIPNDCSHAWLPLYVRLGGLVWWWWDFLSVYKEAFNAKFRSLSLRLCKSQLMCRYVFGGLTIICERIHRIVCWIGIPFKANRQQNINKIGTKVVMGHILKSCILSLFTNFSLL